MPQGVAALVTLAPAVWPGKELPVQPGDLSLFAPMGNGLGAPMVMMPWDGLESIAAREAYYGLQPHTGHPFGGAPITDASGGTVYFDDQVPPGDLAAMLRLMGVHSDLKDFAAFYAEPKGPDERHGGQMRIVSGGALEFLYRTPNDDDSMKLRQQSLTVGEAVAKFVEQFQRGWDDGSLHLSGTLGGDGDWAKESLAFGFMVENQYHRIYRIWMRPWLVTK